MNESATETAVPNLLVTPGEAATPKEAATPAPSGGAEAIPVQNERKKRFSSLRLAGALLRPAGVAEARSLWAERRRRFFVHRMMADFRLRYGAIGDAPPEPSYKTAGVMLAFALIEGYSDHYFAMGVLTVVALFYVFPAAAHAYSQTVIRLVRFVRGDRNP